MGIPPGRAMNPSWGRGAEKPVLSKITARYDIKYFFYLAIIYFLLTSILRQLYLFLDYSSPLGLRDLAFFHQPLQNFITERTLEISVGHHDHQLIFGEHAYLLLILLIPLYYIFKTPLLLILTQPLSYLLMILVVYKILRNVYKEDHKLIICLILILLLLNPVYSMSLLNFRIYGFHMDFYFPPLFLAAYYFYKSEQTK